MVAKLLKGIFEAGQVSEIEAYCMEVQQLGLAGSPTAEEAKKEYRALLLSRVIAQTN